MSEKDEQTRILLALGSRRDIRLWRNTVGEGWQGTVISQTGDRVVLSNARYVTFGLAPGSWDLVGLKRQLIEPQNVGESWARFVGIEVKFGRNGLNPAQKLFHAAIEPFGPLHGIARNSFEAMRIVSCDG